MSWRFWPLVPVTSLRTTPSLSISTVVGVCCTMNISQSVLSPATCVNLKFCRSTMSFISSNELYVTARKFTSGHSSFHWLISGISLMHGPQPVYQKLSTSARPLVDALSHTRPSTSFTLNCPIVSLRQFWSSSARCKPSSLP